jgi:hypothetical protein
MVIPANLATTNSIVSAAVQEDHSISRQPCPRQVEVDHLSRSRLEKIGFEKAQFEKAGLRRSTDRPAFGMLDELGERGRLVEQRMAPIDSLSRRKVTRDAASGWIRNRMDPCCLGPAEFAE